MRQKSPREQAQVASPHFLSASRTGVELRPVRIGCSRPLAVPRIGDAPDQAIDLQLTHRVTRPHRRRSDLLVKLKAVSLNPVDVRVRQSAARTGQAGRTLERDTAGLVEAVGADVTSFKPRR